MATLSLLFEYINELRPRVFLYIPLSVFLLPIALFFTYQKFSHTAFAGFVFALVITSVIGARISKSKKHAPHRPIDSALD